MQNPLYEIIPLCYQASCFVLNCTEHRGRTNERIEITICFVHHETLIVTSIMNNVWIHVIPLWTSSINVPVRLFPGFGNRKVQKEETVASLFVFFQHEEIVMFTLPATQQG